MFRKYKYYWFVLCVLAAVSLFGVWDNNFYIGGDVMIPIIPRNNLHKINMWFAGSDSLHYLHTTWYLYYYFLEKIGIPSQIAQKLLIVASTLLGYSFTYLTFRLVTQQKYNLKEGYAAIAGLIYSLTPATLLVVPGYLPYYGIPICGYFFLKYLKTSSLLEILWFSILTNFYFFVDLPQPKTLLIFGIYLIFLLLISGIRKDKYHLFKDLFVALIVFIFVNSYVFITFIYSVSHGSLGKVATSISSHNGIADLGSASLIYISRFFNTSTYNGYKEIKSFITGWPFEIWSTLLILISMGGLYLKRNNSTDKLWIVSLIFSVTFIFIAKGPNPPFGAVYQFLMNNIPLLRVFRTSASTVIFALLPFSFLVSLSVLSISKSRVGERIVPFFIALHLILFSPILGGMRFHNRFAYPEGKGINIPNDYYTLSNFLDDHAIEGKTFLFPFPDGYIAKKWGYFGPDLISWMTKAELIYRSDLYGISTQNKFDVGNPNMQYDDTKFKASSRIVVQKDSTSSLDIKIPDDFRKELETDNFVIYRNSASTVPKFAFTINDNLVSPEINKIDVTKYEIKPTELNGIFKIVFFENYNEDWKLYLLGGDGGRINIGNKHYVADGYANGWTVDIPNTCKSNSKLCNNNETILNPKIVVEFWPQRLLVSGFYFSGVSILIVLGIHAINQRKGEK